MARTLKLREKFNGVGTLSGSNLGGYFTSFAAGSVTKWRCGAKLTTDTDDGWHGAVTTDLSATCDFSGDAVLGAGYQFECLYWSGEFSTGTNKKILDMNGAGAGPGTGFMWAISRINTTDGTNHKIRFSVGFSDVDFLLPFHSWIRFFAAAKNVGGTNWDFHIGYEIVGSGGAPVIVTAYNGDFGLTSMTVQRSFSAAAHGYALAMVTLYSIGALAEATKPADVVYPTDTSNTWHVTSGATAGDGTDVSPLNATQLAAAFASSGILGRAGTGDGYGDLVIFDDAVYLSPAIVATVRQRGCKLKAPAGVLINMYKTISGTWTRPDAGGAPNVWQIADSETITGGLIPCMFVDNKGMNPKVGANLAAVKAALNATNNSYWSDGTTMYLGSTTNPNNNGSVYIRSAAPAGGFISVGGGAVCAAVAIAGQDQMLENIHTLGPAYYDPADLQNSQGLGITDASGRVGGKAVNISSRLAGKHGIGWTAPTTDGVQVYGFSIMKLWPEGFGAVSAMVNFVDTGTQLNNLWHGGYVPDDQHGWKAGSTDGQHIAAALYLAHGDGAFDNVTFEEMIFGDGDLGPGNVGTMTLINCDSWTGGIINGAFNALVRNTVAGKPADEILL